MPKLIGEETLCCGGKRCPVVRHYDDGSLELSDDDAELGSVGTIKLQSEQVRRLVEISRKRA